MFAVWMKSWIEQYLKEQSRAALSLPVAEIQKWIGLLSDARERGSQVFACGNGGSAANCSHFATDLGKGASGIVAGKPTADESVKRFRVMSLNDNLPWIGALANDCSYDDVYVEQLKNFGRKDDVFIGVSVSGNSPNVVKALEWAGSAGLITLALVGNKTGNKMSKLAKHVISVDSGHYGRVEDSQMHVLHLLCYAFIENQA